MGPVAGREGTLALQSMAGRGSGEGKGDRTGTWAWPGQRQESWHGAVGTSALVSRRAEPPLRQLCSPLPSPSLWPTLFVSLPPWGINDLAVDIPSSPWAKPPAWQKWE